MPPDLATERISFRERPPCPPWVYLAFFALPAGFFGSVLAIFYLLGAHGYYASTAIVLFLASVGLGALPALSQLIVKVDASGLHVGRTTIPFDSITATRPVEGSELRDLRHEIGNLGQPWPGVPRVGPLSSGIGMMYDGVAMIRSADRRRGMHASPWQPRALYVETPGAATKQWIIATRDPSQLAHAIASASASNT